VNRAIVVKPQTEVDMKFLSNLLEKLGIQSTSIDAELIEDLGMSILMNDTNRTKKVSRETVVKKLRS
jgi:hypothetical protein